MEVQRCLQDQGKTLFLLLGDCPHQGMLCSRASEQGVNYGPNLVLSHSRKFCHDQYFLKKPFPLYFSRSLDSEKLWHPGDLGEKSVEVTSSVTWKPNDLDIKHAHKSCWGLETQGLIFLVLYDLIHWGDKKAIFQRTRYPWKDGKRSGLLPALVSLWCHCLCPHPMSQPCTEEFFLPFTEHQKSHDFPGPFIWGKPIILWVYACYSFAFFLKQP